MKKILIAAVAALVLVGGFIFFKSTYSGKDANELIVGVMSGYAPFATIDERGELEGFDIDIASELSRRLGKKIVFKDMNLSALIIALCQKKIDILLSGMGITEERKNIMKMVYYQGESLNTNPLVFWEKIPKDIARIEDFKKYPQATICVEPGSFQEKFLLEFDFLNLKEMSVMSEIVLDLKYAKSLAAFMDPEILPLLKKQNPELVSIEIDLPREFQMQGNGIGINKESIELISQVTNVIAAMQQDGTIRALENKWFNAPEAANE